MPLYHVESNSDNRESGERVSIESVFAKAGLDVNDPRFQVQHHHVPAGGVSVDITVKQAECLRDNGFTVLQHI